MGLVLLVRHGQASFGGDDYDVLSELGLTQGRRLGEVLGRAGVEPTAVIHGAQRRQRDTALAMAAGAGWAVEPELDDGWNEFDHLGVVARGLEGLGETADLSDRRTFQQAFERATARWCGGAHDDDYDEPWPAFVTRVSDALQRTDGRPGVTVVVSSGGPIAASCAQLVDAAADPAGLARLWNAFNTVCANTGVTRMIVGSTGRRLLTFNEHSHLPREQVTYR